MCLSRELCFLWTPEHKLWAMCTCVSLLAVCYLSRAGSEKRVQSHVNCPSFQPPTPPDFDQNWNIQTQFSRSQHHVTLVCTLLVRTNWQTDVRGLLTALRLRLRQKCSTFRPHICMFRWHLCVTPALHGYRPLLRFLNSSLYSVGESCDFWFSESEG